jgi:hypothetical protein
MIVSIMADSNKESNEGSNSHLDNDEPQIEPCSRCGVMLQVVPMGCKTFHCPHCGNPYPFGDCSDM